MNYRRLLISGLVTIISSSAYSREIYYGSEPETVTVTYGGPTIFRFDEKVKTISQAAQFTIKPADDDAPNYAVLAVTPRFTQGKSEVTFILANGVVINTRLVIVSKAIPEKTDSFYDFKPKENQLKALEKDQAGTEISELELMKAMIRGEKIVGYEVRPLERTVDTGVAELSAKLVKVYTGPKYNGYVYRVQNSSRKKSYAIDLKNLYLGRPNTALLSQVDNKILEGAGSKKSSTFLRIVAKPASVYYNINLPVTPIAKK